jgi:hypothetical protein
MGSSPRRASSAPDRTLRGARGLARPPDRRARDRGRAGEVAVVAPGTPHSFWNAGDSVARFLCEVRPAFRFESLIETMFTLAA